MLRPALLVLLAAFALSACDSTDPDLVVTASSVVTVSYVGSLEDGTVFDQNPSATFSMGQVIPGFRDGLLGLRVGDTKTFDIPPELAYGEQGVPGVIPPNATLTFEVEILNIQE